MGRPPSLNPREALHIYIRRSRYRSPFSSTNRQWAIPIATSTCVCASNTQQNKTTASFYVSSCSCLSRACLGKRQTIVSHPKEREERKRKTVCMCVLLFAPPATRKHLLGTPRLQILWPGQPLGQAHHGQSPCLRRKQTPSVVLSAFLVLVPSLSW